MAGFEGFLLLFGGEGEEKELNDLWVFNLKTKNWHEIIPIGSAPKPRKGHSCAVYTVEEISLLLVIGGNSKGTYLSELNLMKLSPVKDSISVSWITNEFKQIGASYTSREGASLLVQGSSILLISGCNYMLSTCYGDLYTLEIEISPAKNYQFLSVPLEFTPQEKSLPLFSQSTLYIIPGHSKSNKLLKSAVLISLSTSCSGHGAYKNDHCECVSGFFGEKCENSCVLCKNGICMDSKCVCSPGYSGSICESSDPIFLQGLCAHNCHNRGSCSNGICNCLPSFFGVSCEFKHCSSSCGQEINRGVCDHDTGVCQCQEKYGGDKCQYECPYGCPEGFLCINNYQCACHDCPASSLNCNEHGTLIGDSCNCLPGFCGKFCENKCPSCSGHGEFTGSCCECFEGYYGLACESMCPKRCSGHGKCLEGECVCENGWEGDDCSQNFTCAGCRHGICSHGQCKCFPGYTGGNCEIVACPMNCTVLSARYEIYGETTQVFYSLEEVPAALSGSRIVEIINTAGYCNLQNALCECYQGFTGSDCSGIVECPENCNRHGLCIQGICQCDTGYSGPSCGLNSCKNSCTHNGACLHGKCACFTPWGNEDCSACQCKHGVCSKDSCTCEHGWTGELCDTNTCGKCVHGLCQDGRCTCAEGFSGENCDKCEDFLACFRCNYDEECTTGRCVQGACLCDNYHTGKRCELLLCSGHGVMHHGGCVCNENYTGSNCSIPLTCPNFCSNHGVCHNGQCFCDPDFEGFDCKTPKKCPENCNNNGICKFGKCLCNAGFQGISCLPSKKANKCEESCEGVCIAGKCYCISNDFSSEASPNAFVETASCPLDCSNHGKCLGNSCFCDSGWIGDACEIHMILDNSRFCMNDGTECTGNGICSNGKCYCDSGFSGVYCELNSECLGCTGEHQVCVKEKCECLEGWAGSLCTVEKSCLGVDCGQFGECRNGECLCEYGYSSNGGEPCSTEIVSLLGVAFVVSLIYALVIWVVIKMCRK